MTDDAQLTIDGTELDDQLTIETSGRVIRPFNRLIGEVVDEYKLEATPEGLHVRAVDPPNVMYVDSTLPAESLNALSIDGSETAIGISTDAVKSLLSDARYGKSTDDPVSLSSDGATLEASIERDYSGVPATVTNRAKTIDPAALRSQPDLLELDRVLIPLPPDAFIDVVSSFDSFGVESVSISVVDGVLTFKGKTDTRARNINLEVGDGSDVVETRFSLDYLKTISAGLKTSYAKTASMALGEELPLTVRFITEQDIEAEYTVAPRVGNR